MVCNFSPLMGILPAWLRRELTQADRDQVQELRLRRGSPAQLIVKDGRRWLRGTVRQEDLTYCVNAASQYSPWAFASTAAGYLTIEGGHRIGLCGEMILKEGAPCGFRSIRSLSIRVARDFPGIAGSFGDLSGSILILGAPGRGKTTLLRDLIRQRAAKQTVGVVDERSELFPEGFSTGLQTDILSGCSKAQGILQLLRTMGPETIAVDEITDPADCSSLLSAGHCGVSILATAHAESYRDFQNRLVYQDLQKNRLFSHVLTLQKDQTCQVERMEL